jgi:hypothetical protein
MGYVAGLMAHKKEREQKEQSSKGAREQRKRRRCYPVFFCFFCQNPITPSGDGPKKHPDGATR